MLGFRMMEAFKPASTGVGTIFNNSSYTSSFVAVIGSGTISYDSTNVGVKLNNTATADAVYSYNGLGYRAERTSTSVVKIISMSSGKYFGISIESSNNVGSPFLLYYDPARQWVFGVYGGGSWSSDLIVFGGSTVSSGATLTIKIAIGSTGIYTFTVNGTVLGSYDTGDTTPTYRVGMYASSAAVVFKQISFN